MTKKSAAVVIAPQKEVKAALKKVQQGMEAGCQAIAVAGTFEDNLATIDTYCKMVQSAQLWAKWNIGRLCSAMSEDEGRYGAKSVDRIAEHVGMKPRVVYEMQKLYRVYPEHKQIKQLEDKDLGWRQAVLLCQVPNAKSRQEIVTKVVSEDLNCREMATLVKSYAPSGKAPAAAPVKDPKAFDLIQYLAGYAQEMEAMNQKMVVLQKMQTTAIKVMEGSSDDVFFKALTPCKAIKNAVEQSKALIVNIDELLDWEELRAK